jgi:PAS domain S-box-containing protein
MSEYEIDALRKRVAELEKLDAVRKKSEERIKELAEEWQKTFDSISDLIFMQNTDHTILRVNKAFAAAIKMKPEDIMGKKCYELLHKSNSPWPDCPFERTKKDKAAHVQEVDDANIGMPLLVTTSPVFNDRGELTGSVHVAKDITLIKDKEKELARKMRDLEIFNKAAVGRELKMEELKARIRELEAKLGGKS